MRIAALQIQLDITRCDKDTPLAKIEFIRNGVTNFEPRMGYQNGNRALAIRDKISMLHGESAQTKSRDPAASCWRAVLVLSP